MTDGVTRRVLLQQALAGVSVALPGMLQAASAPCDAWGALSAGSPGPVCGSAPGFKLLDVWLRGGASPWETFWIPGAPGVPDLGRMSVADLPLDEIDWTGGAIDADSCTGPGVPTSSDDMREFWSWTDTDAIFWGPATKPLWDRPDIFNRTRILTQAHPLEPHQAAAPFGLTGLKLGNARRAGTGAAVQRRHLDLYPEQVMPVSYVFHYQKRYVADHAAMLGIHPASARPLVVEVGSSQFAGQLDRPSVNPATDPLFDVFRSAFADQMRWGGANEMARSTGYEAYRIGTELLSGADMLTDVFANIPLATGGSAHCPLWMGDLDIYKPHLKTELGAAAYLLSQNLARYVCVVDDGIGGSYDTHPGTAHTLRVSANVLNLSRHLAATIWHPELNPAGTINLDDTLIVISSEFGRTPQLVGTGMNAGRNHWPYGYVSVLIGGPITARGARGGIDGAGVALAAHSYTPADLRGAMLLAAGIDPFSQGCFRVDDFSTSLKSGQYTESGIRDRLAECAFGV